MAVPKPTAVRFATPIAGSPKPLLRVVIAELVPVIQASRPDRGHVDGRNKPGHDGLRGSENSECPVNLVCEPDPTAMGQARPKRLKAGTVDHADDGRIRFPYDEIHIDFDLRAA
jgi:hypothetical protein